MARRPRRPSAETRAEILAKAQDLFRDAGYAKTSVADIAAALDMSPANIFKHFPSKAALAEAISAIHLGFISGALAAIPAELTASERLRRFAEVILAGHLEYSEANPHIFDLVVHMMSIQPEIVREFEAALRRDLEAIVVAGHESGEFAPVDDPSALAYVLLDSITGVTHPLLIQHFDRSSLFARLERVIDFLIAALRS